MHPPIQYEDTRVRSMDTYLQYEHTKIQLVHAYTRTYIYMLVDTMTTTDREIIFVGVSNNETALKPLISRP